MDFVAIDVETANADLASICQIGIVGFQNGSLKESWQSLIDPEDYFDDVNVSIHGIDELDVVEAPTLPEICDAIHSRLRDAVVVSHSPFDRLAVTRAFEKYDLECVECAWLDTVRVGRRAWPEFSHLGFGLASLATQLGIAYTPHNAEEDARATAEILVHATAKSGLTVREWIERVKRPIDPSRAAAHARITTTGNPEGALYGNVLVFTGALSIPRIEAVRIAAEAGCDIVDAVSKKTTLVVVGDQDARKLVGHEKSSKHRKAEALISAGMAIRIMGESDFRRLVGLLV
ncbi:MAG TPA: exonuclease domain-containing protein [Chloroflexota bacterium]|nr:exonuclease domain-containing protein [Chloroflexota bacterium]